MYEYKSLEEIEFSQIAQCIKSAFSDYCVQADMDESQLYERFHTENVRYELSHGAFCQGKLIGVLLNAVGKYGKEIIAYDAVTGVAVGHRRKGIYSHMMAHCMDALKKEGISRYVLEVIQSNEGAVNIYKKMGLNIVREYACFRGKATILTEEAEPALTVPAAMFPLECMEKQEHFSPSFENRTETIRAFEEKFAVLYDGNLNDCNAFVVYHIETGQIKQLGRKDGCLNTLSRLLSCHSRQYQEIKIHNISFEDEELIDLLEEMGFEHFCDQFEMDMKFSEK